jgi:dTDP-4-dehydrorhamnose reductase
MKILLFGRDGQVGWELQRSLAPLGDLIVLHSSSKDMCGDLTDLEGIAQTVRQAKPDIIVNAAAYTAVDKAESEPERARTINAAAPGVLGREAKALDAWLVHYSTDYVFDGSGVQPWREEDQAKPLNVYGATKLEGEHAIHASRCRHLIFRTSWVYGVRGQNFVKTMLRLARENDQLNVIDDQTGAPTGADLLADVTAHALLSVRRQPELGGLYHVAANGETTWHGYASFVIEFARANGMEFKLARGTVTPVPSSAFPTPAQRPHNSRLATAKLQRTFNLHLPNWQAGLARMLSEFLDRQ